MPRSAWNKPRARARARHLMEKSNNEAAPTEGQPASPHRRRMLGAAGVAFAGLAAAAHSAHSAHAAGTPDSGAQVTDAPQSTHTQDRVPFRGKHQAGIVTPRPTAGMI